MNHFSLIAIAMASMTILWNVNAKSQPVPKKPDGTGTFSNPIKISCASELYWLTQNPEAWDAWTIIYQVAHIDLKDYNNWGVIGTEDTPFRGIYNGQGYTIRNLTIDSTGVDNIGLFGFIEYDGYSVGVMNLGLINVNIRGQNGVGGMVGSIVSTYQVKTKNSYVSGGLVKGSGMVGGLVGCNSAVSGVVCSGSFPYISNCFSDVDVLWDGNGGGNRIGGLVGCNARGRVLNSYSRGDVLVDNSHGLAQVGERVGGLAGSSGSLGVIEYAYSSGLVSVTNIDYVGGLTGYTGDGSQEGTIVSSFYDEHTDGQGQPLNPEVIGGNNVNTLCATSTSQMLEPETYTTNNGEPSWDDNGTWILASGAYPLLMDKLTDEPLPVELILLTAREKDGQVQVKWSVATETNNHYYEVQASYCGQNYTSQGVVAGAGTTSLLTSYSWSFPYSKGMKYVRLWQVDMDGSGEHLGPVDIHKQYTEKSPLTVYPNPAVNTIFVRTEQPLTKGTTVSLYGMDGKRLLSYSACGQSNPWKVNIPEHIPWGMYLLKVEEKPHLSKIVIVKER